MSLDYLYDMIPYLPKDTPDTSIPEFYQQVMDNLEMRCGHHETWFTHKKDPSVCWVCDLLELTKICVREMERYISKSALDIDEQFQESEKLAEESVNYNVDDENSE